MNVAPGTRLGPYEIVSAIGSGGMGEVYRARDTRLDRSVAIKLLSRDIAQSAEFRARFEREARAISSLSHANICTLYDIGEQDGSSYLVMEFVEGETLADRLARGPLTPEQVLKMGVELADALERAHRAGVIHRDLKPGNVMLTKSGAKLLDFGLAKPASAAVSGATAVLSSMTIAKPLTTEGMIVGTFQYMAPEQIEGKEADPRSDIFALGAVLYEAATARKAFNGRTQASVIAAVLAAEPEPMSQIAPLTPPALERVVKTCLAKDPDERLQTTHDLKLQLKWIADGSAVTGVPQTSVRKLTARHRWERIVFAALCVGLAAATLAFALKWWSAQKLPRQSYRFVIPPQEGLRFGRAMAFSPNGQVLAFVGEDGAGITRIWLRRLDGEQVEFLGGTEGADYPFWSPDSKRLAFFAQGKLKTISADGGAPRILCDIAEPRGGAWGADDTIVFAPNWQTALYKVSATGGGKPEPVTQLQEGVTSHRWPAFLPDGKHFLFYIRAPEKSNGGVFVASVDGDPPQRVTEGSSFGIYIEPGYLLYALSGSLVAQNFDVTTLKVSGDPIRVADKIAQDSSIEGNAGFAASSSGNVVWRSVAVQGATLTWFDRSGKRLASVGSSAPYTEPAISHDGRKVAIARGDDIVVMDLRSIATERVSFQSAYAPVWSPDDTKVVFSSAQQGISDIFEVNLEKRSPPRVVYHSEATKNVSDWSRDGRYILFDNAEGSKKYDIHGINLQTGESFPVVESPYTEFLARFSPDSKWIVYISDESGTNEVYVQQFPSGTNRVAISVGGGTEPIWLAGGREIVYLAPDKKLMSVAIRFENGRLVAGSPAALFHSDVVGLADARNHYVPSEDGQRFLVLEEPSENLAAPLHVVINWPASIRNYK